MKGFYFLKFLSFSFFFCKTKKAIHRGGWDLKTNYLWRTQLGAPQIARYLWRTCLVRHR